MIRQTGALRSHWTFENKTSENDGALPLLSVPAIMLYALTTSTVGLWIATLLFTVPAVVLGHWQFALGFALLAMVSDLIIQRLYRRLALIVEDEPRRVWWILTASLALRATVAMATPVTLALVKPGPAELVFSTVSACLLLCVAVSQGQLSRRLFWASATPVVVGMAIIILAAFPPLQAGALLFMMALVCVFLAAIGGAGMRILGDWNSLRESNNRLIDRLKSEREEAESAREDARSAGQAKANFLATMSHEIRTPMNGVLGMAQLLQKTARDDEQRRQIDTLIHSGEFLLSILNDILDISKIDAGKLEIAAAPEDPRTLLDGLVQLWLPAAADKGLYLTTHIDETVPELLDLDARRLRQILFNLIGNALKFTSEGGVAVNIDARPISRTRVRLHISVRDTGIGLDPQAISALFERFSQADQSTSRRFGGAGLGLAISRQLAELMEGELWAEGERGVGACFHLSLPVKIAESAANVEAEDATPVAEAAPLSLLIVDDNPVNLTVLEQILNAFGHRVIQASSGPEAIERAAVEVFDLVLMDIQMPGMSGIDTLNALRILGGPNAATPTLAVTADVLSSGRDDYIAKGFSGHVAKPVQIPELIAEMSRVLDAVTEEPAAA